MADSESLPAQESLDKPFRHPVQEGGFNRGFELAALTGQQQGIATERHPLEHPQTRVTIGQMIVQLFITVGNFSLANFFGILYATAIAIFKIIWEWVISKENIEERDEMKRKAKEIKDVHLKEIGHHKGNLEEKVRHSI